MKANYFKNMLDFVLDILPENQKENDFIILDFRKSSHEFILNKPVSNFELIVDNNCDMYYAIKYELDLFWDKIKSLPKDIHPVDMLTTNPSDYMENAVKRYLMSGLDYNKTYIKKLSKRLKDVNILRRSFLDLIKAFNHDNAFIYYNPETIDMSNDSVIDYQNSVKKVLHSFRGKAIIVEPVGCNLYRKLYKDWHLHKVDDINLLCNYAT